MTDVSVMSAAPVKLGLFRAATTITLVTLPFMTAMTLDVGFPLKIYEVVLLIAMVLVPFSGRLSLPRRALTGAALTAAWIGLAGIFLILRLTFPLDTMVTAGLVTRFGPIGDGITKFIYLLLDLFAFILFARFAARSEKGFLRYWLYGAIIAASYGYYLMLMGLLNIATPPLLPGAADTDIVIAGHVFIRCATFREGNEAGLYFAVSSLLAFHAGRKKTGWFIMGAIITTFSTLALIVLLGVLSSQVWQRFRKFSVRAKILLAPIVLLAFLTAATGIAATTIFQISVVNKLSSAQGPDAASRLERLAFAQAAWDMFLDHPVTGVGLAQFGYNFPSYSTYPVRVKQIPNIIYLEFLSEDGLIVFAIFLVFFFFAFRRTKGEMYLRAAFLSLTLGFLAYSTISVMFIWALFGLLYGRQPLGKHGLAV